MIKSPVRAGLPDCPGRRLLTGTFPLPPGTPAVPPASILRLAQRSDALARLLDSALLGIESIQAAFKEGEKQTMLWREELETCGQQQGSEWPRTRIPADLK